jgi:hypothetical protein
LDETGDQSRGALPKSHITGKERVARGPSFSIAPGRGLKVFWVIAVEELVQDICTLVGCGEFFGFMGCTSELFMRPVHAFSIYYDRLDACFASFDTLDAGTLDFARGIAATPQIKQQLNVVKLPLTKPSLR